MLCSTIHRICRAASVACPSDTRSKHGVSVTRVPAKAVGGHTTNGMIPFSSNASVGPGLEHHWIIGCPGVHGVIATTKRYDTPPGDRKAVCLDSVLCQKRGVLFPESVRVPWQHRRRDRPKFFQSERLLRKAVPDGLTTTIDVR